MKNIRLLLVDEKMNTVEIEIEQWQFRNLGIKQENVKKHKSKTALNKEIADFILSTVKD